MWAPPAEMAAPLAETASPWSVVQHPAIALMAFLLLLCVFIYVLDRNYK